MGLTCPALAWEVSRRDVPAQQLAVVGSAASGPVAVDSAVMVEAAEVNMKLVFVSALFVGLVFAACQTDPKAKAKAQEDAMIQEAQRAQAEESSFDADSLKLAKTFEVKTISSAKTMNFTEEDDDGDDVSVPHYYFLAPDLKVCQVSQKAYTTKAVGDTLNCQWSDKYEQ